MRDLTRLLRPSSVAVVGASENHSRARSAVQSLMECDVELHLVNPRRPIVFGQETYPSLADLPEPTDVVLSLVNATASIDVVGQAAAAGSGGVIVNADGFDAVTDSGERLSDLLMAAAGGRTIVLGPNCNGYIDANRGLRLSGAPRLPLLPGSVGLVTHSGGLIGSLGVTGAERGFGFSHMISMGNELDLRMADCLEFLIEDDQTSVVALIIETIRDPEAFLRALEKAHTARKPVVALSLARSARSREIARSHTGAVTGDDWTYQSMFRQFGVQPARDIPDLADQLMCFAQFPPEQWSPARGVAVLTSSGGWAALASDIAEDEGVNLPELATLKPTLQHIVPSADVANPLDMTGRLVSDDGAIRLLVDAYLSSPEVDMLLALWFLDDAGLEMGSPLLEALRDAAAGSRKPIVVASIEDASYGPETHKMLGDGVARGRGVRGTLRAIRAMNKHMEARERAVARPLDMPRSFRRPEAVVLSTAGPMLSFASAMSLLTEVGIQVAPFVVIDGREQIDPASLPAARSYVVKLADVPHRTDIGAVLTRVSPDDVHDAVERMREVARAGLLPDAVVVQTQLEVSAEALLAIDTRSDLGPFVAFGPGGILVELGSKPAGALAPVTAEQADDMLEAVAETGMFDNIRGSKPWDRAEAAGVVARLSELAVAGESWLETLEINPLALVDGHAVALDCLCLTKPD